MNDKFLIPEYFLDSNPQALREDFLKRFPKYQGQEEAILLIYREHAKHMGFLTEEEELYQSILERPEYYTYVEKLIGGEIPKIIVGLVYKYSAARIIEISKVSLIENIEKLKAKGKISFTDETRKRFNKLSESAFFASYIKNIGNKKYHLRIDDMEYDVPIPVLLSFIFLDKDSFYASFKNEKINDINSFHFAYLVAHFLKYEILNNYLVPDIIKKRYQEIVDSKLIDIQALNQKYDNGGDIVSQVKVNPELKMAILKDIPNNLTLLEKSIFIYLRMCDLLTYDDEYYVFDQRGEVVKKHADINHIREISPTNNLVVCYEFAAIYAFLLREYNIPLEIRYGENKKNYGSEHAFLEYRISKYMVSADAFTGILNGDVFYVKVGKPLVGLECINENAETSKEFMEIEQQVYDLFLKLKIQSEELKSPYTEMLPEVIDKTFEERMQILASKINDTPYTGMTPMAYLISLKHSLFKDKEIKITIVKNNITSNAYKKAMATAIITINKNGITEDSSNNSYFIYDEEGYLRPITITELRRNFQEKIYQYVSRYDPLIPGLNYSGRGF